MPNNEEMILQLDANLFEVFWSTYGSKININNNRFKNKE